MNIIEDLQQELDRNKKILTFYESIPQGAFGAVFIREGITSAEKAIAEMDTVKMITALKYLREIE